MKKILIFLIFLVNQGISQTTPYLLKDSSGGEFVILSVDQARRLDNLSEGKCDSVIDSLTNLVKVRKSEFDEYQKNRSEFYNHIQYLEEVIKIKDKQINLTNENLLQTQKFYETEIKSHKVKSKQEKTLRYVLVGIATASFVAMVSILGL